MSSVLAGGIFDNNGRRSIDVSAEEKNDFEEMTIELEYDFIDVKVDGYIYKVPSIVGGFHSNIEGCLVPSFTLEIPIDGSIKDLTVEFRSPLKRSLSHTPYSYDGIENAKTIKIDKSIEIENKYEYKQIERTWDQQDILSLKSFPVHYHGTGEATLYQEMKVRYCLDYTTSPEQLAPSTRKPVGSLAYLIITTDELKDSVMPLARWKSQRGNFAHVETVENIENNISGRDVPEKIRNYIMKVHREQNLRYLLLAGDYEDVPTRETLNNFVVEPRLETDYFASDIYYACLDEWSTWDIDGDGVFGENGDIDDLYPDIFYGRLAIAEPEKMSAKVNELVEREKNPKVQKNSNTALLAASEEHNVLYFETMLDRLNDLGSYDTWKMYFNESGDELLSSHAFKSRMEETYPFIFYSGHGFPDQYHDLIDNNDVRSFEQEQLGGYVFTLSCDTGWFDDPDGFSSWKFEDCISEELTENVGKGVVGCSAANRLALTMVDSQRRADANALMESALESLMVMRSGEAPTVAGLPHIYALCQYVLDFAPFSAGYDIDLRCYLEYNFFGDPNAPLYLDDPTVLQMDVELSDDGSYVTAEVTDDKNELQEDVYVILYREGELGIWGKTDENGFVKIDLPKNNGGIINVTASRSGDKPYCTSIILEDTLEPKPTLNTDPFSPNGLNWIFITSPNITIYADETATIEYKMNGESMGSSDREVVRKLQDGNYVIEVKATDPAGHTSDWVTFEISVDTKIPELIPITDPEIADGENGWYTALTRLSLDSNEKLLEGNISIDNGEPIDMHKSILLLEGTHSYTLRGMDLAGLTNNSTIILCLDTESPKGLMSISHKPDGLNGYYVEKPTITFDLDDDLSFVEYRFEETGPWERLNESFNLPDGEYLLNWRIRDQAGNIGTSGNHMFKIDTQPPPLEYSISPETPDGLRGYYNTIPTIYVNSSFNEGYYLLLDEYQNVDWEYGIEIQNGEFTVPDGDWSVYIMTRDVAGNSVEEGPIDIKVDTSPTDLRIEINPPHPDGSDGWYTSSVQLLIRGEEILDETEISYNGLDWWPLEGLVTLEQGIHNVKLRSVDRAGNINLVDIQEIKIDTSIPVISGLVPSAGDTVGKDVDHLSFDVIDIFGTGISSYISVDRSSWIEIGNRTEFQIKDLKDGKHNIRINVIDQAGNSVTHDHYFSIDRTPPSIFYTSPENGVIEGSESEIYIEFTEPMDTENTFASVDEELIEVEWILSSSFSIDLERYGKDDSIHMIHINGTDLYGNRMENVNVEFQFKFEDEIPVPQKESDDNSSIIMILFLIGIIISAVLTITGAVIWKSRSVPDSNMYVQNQNVNIIERRNQLP
jgi:hypothetical protein